MLTEERYATILRILKEKRAVTVPELTRALCTSESTIRRDLTVLHKRGLLYKVYGGATSIDNNYSAMEEDMPTKNNRCTEEKIAIARRAAALVTRRDFVYIDAGSTTLHLVDFLKERQAVYVTNGLPHASRLSAKGFKVFMLGGQIKSVTEAVIGTEALHNLELYNFTKGFFGVNGISVKSGSPLRIRARGSSRAKHSPAASTRTSWPISQSSTRSHRSHLLISQVPPSSPVISSIGSIWTAPRYWKESKK